MHFSVQYYNALYVESKIFMRRKFSIARDLIAGIILWDGYNHNRGESLALVLSGEIFICKFFSCVNYYIDDAAAYTALAKTEYIFANACSLKFVLQKHSKIFFFSYRYRVYHSLLIGEFVAHTQDRALQVRLNIIWWHSEVAFSIPCIIPEPVCHWSSWYSHLHNKYHHLYKDATTYIIVGTISQSGSHMLQFWMLSIIGMHKMTDQEVY